MPALGGFTMKQTKPCFGTLCLHRPLHCVPGGEGCQISIRSNFCLSISDKVPKGISEKGTPPSLRLQESLNFFLILNKHHLSCQFCIFLKQHPPLTNCISLRLSKPRSLLGSAGPWWRFCSAKMKWGKWEKRRDFGQVNNINHNFIGIFKKELWP